MLSMWLRLIIDFVCICDFGGNQVVFGIFGLGEVVKFGISISSS